eukprot:m.79074 g.79074  ORF g.79074 m.79074 type:complete len:90 (-) comp50620_c0_seq2:357-626(-)
MENNSSTKLQILVKWRKVGGNISAGEGPVRVASSRYALAMYVASSAEAPAFDASMQYGLSGGQCCSIVTTYALSTLSRFGAHESALPAY